MKLKIVFGLLIFSLMSPLSLCCSSKINFKKIEINDGIIRGVKNTTIIDNEDYYAFRGIPFAKPPIGIRRFMAPERPEPWGQNVLDTLNYRSYCPQKSYDVNKQPLVGEEDCLYLNVYTPVLRPTSKLSVMVFIHGGGLTEGNGDDFYYGPDFLIVHNIIYVAINYRLGILGFMSMGTDEYSGNMGMKDQVMALQWVYDNIHHFGGDNNQITIFGESAGSLSVHLHTLSPVSKDLFNRAIMQSGSALNVWAYKNISYQDELFEIAKQHGKNTDNVDELIEYLKGVDFTELVSTFKLKDGKDFGIVIEAKSVQSAFLTDTPESILECQEEKKCDRLFGFNSNLLYANDQVKNPNLIKDILDHFNITLPNREFQFDFNSSEYKMMASEIKAFYFGENIEINNETISKFIDLFSDIYFSYNIDTSAKSHAKDQEHKTYYYTFSVDANFNVGKKIFAKIDLPGTAHVDEICYLFPCKFFFNEYKNLKADSVELQTIKIMTKMWTNFAKYGNPTPEAIPVDWKPIQSSQINFIDVNNDGVLPGEDPHSENFDFWNKLFNKYRPSI